MAVRVEVPQSLRSRGMTGWGEAAAPPTQVENLRYREMENGLGRRQAPAEQGGRGTTKARRHEGGRPAAGMRLRRSTRPTFRGG